MTIYNQDDVSTCIEVYEGLRKVGYATALFCGNTVAYRLTEKGIVFLMEILGVQPTTNEREAAK